MLMGIILNPERVPIGCSKTYKHRVLREAWSGGLFCFLSFHLKGLKPNIHLF